MKVLLVDNGTQHLISLKRLLEQTTLTVIKYPELNPSNTKDFDLIVLSGGPSSPTQGNETRFQKEINIIKNHPKPIFGICFGFELIAYTFGAKLQHLPKKEHGILDIQILRSDKIFQNIPNFQVFEAHRWVIKETTDKLTALASSKDGIEAIKHKTSPIYAVQFHPEMFVKKTCGEEIFQNFLASLDTTPKM